MVSTVNLYLSSLNIINLKLHSFLKLKHPHREAIRQQAAATNTLLDQHHANERVQMMNLQVFHWRKKSRGDVELNSYRCPKSLFSSRRLETGAIADQCSKSSSS
ncbi:unnamed protein product [Calypogeia fissa]